MEKNATAASLIEVVKRDGFVVVHNMFDEGYIRPIRDELKGFLEEDKAIRLQQGIAGTRKDEFGLSTMTHGSQMLLGLFGRSPRYAQMMNDILSDPGIGGLLRAIAGGGYTLRGDNVRQSTEKVEPAHPLNLPHEWHRDNPGEFATSILLTDIVDKDAGATAFLPGTHLMPFDPRRNVLMGRPAYLALKDVGGPISFCNTALAERSIFGKFLAKRLVRRAQQALGKAGTICIFLNDTWHGRSCNVTGRPNMVTFCGAISSRYPFPTNLEAPHGTDATPEPLRSVLNTKQEPDPNEQCILQWAEANRKWVFPPNLLWLAQKEHSIISARSVKMAKQDKKYVQREWQAGHLRSS